MLKYLLRVIRIFTPVTLLACPEMSPAAAGEVDPS